MVEVGEHPSGLQKVEYLAVERALALVLEVVNRHRRGDGVESPQIGQRIVEVVLDDLHALGAGEPLARRGQHQLGEVEAHASGAISLDEYREQAPVARTEIEHSPRA